MDEDVRKPLTYLAMIAVVAGLYLGWDRVKAFEVFGSDFAEGKDRGHVNASMSSQELVYKVQTGDSWGKIARDHSVSTRALLDANGANIGTELVPGQNIHLPAAAPTAPVH
jgi:spore germination protein YaaH